MIVLIDTSVWSLFYRRKSSDLSPDESAIVDRLSELVAAKQSRIIGPIRQELLSGIKDETNFERLRIAVSAFIDESLDTADYEEAGRCFNRCRRSGIDPAHTDILICAAALRRGMTIFTLDKNLQRCCRLLKIALLD